MIDPIASPSLMAGSSEEKSCIARSYDLHEASVKGNAVYVRLIVASAIISRTLQARRKILVGVSVLVRMDFSVLAANNALESPDLTSATPEIYHSTDVRCLCPTMLAKYGFDV
jgi:hypothetical protein